MVGTYILVKPRKFYPTEISSIRYYPSCVCWGTWSKNANIATHIFRYTLRYIAMQLRLLLHSKFPEAPEDEVVKTVGNIVYYRYMNPAIVAPDGFDVIKFEVGRTFPPEQVGASWPARVLYNLSCL